MHDRVAFVVGGRAVGPVPELEGPIFTGLELILPDQDAANALVTRLRPGGSRGGR